ncbi:hypothetical protein ACEWY4_021863 [Coilia grayii]|uniref:EGF-like domain-containing protein n=1 Tax=Coilia grayii TaxID=363190 RepID=A0ABD1J686_9TELE
MEHHNKELSKRVGQQVARVQNPDKTLPSATAVNETETSFGYELDVTVNLTSAGDVDKLRNILDNQSYPIIISQQVEITQINITTDINECDLDPCGLNSTCSNTIGSYNCSCWKGYAPTNTSISISTSNPCIDINECDWDPCGLNSNCSNTIGNYNCSCWTGYSPTNSSLPISSSNPCKGPATLYKFEIEVGTLDADQVKTELSALDLPVPLSEDTEISQINITTVCYSNSSGYRCVCEEQYAWPHENCITYGACDDSSGGTCGCINGLPREGQLCQRDMNECDLDPCGLNSTCSNTIGSYNCSCWKGYAPRNTSLSISTSNPCIGPATLYKFEIEVGTLDADQVKTELSALDLPVPLSEDTEISQINITTVCNSNSSGYRCVCEEQYAWPHENCITYGACDDSSGGTCGCINGLPREGQLCQRGKYGS